MTVISVTNNPFHDKAATWEKAHKCHQYALFFHGISSGWIFIVPSFFAILSAVFTGYIRSVTPGVGDQTPPKPPSTDLDAEDVEATSVPDLSGAGAETSLATDQGTFSEESDEPPPYQGPATQNTPHLSQTTPIKRSSAQRFVTGTILFMCNITSLFLLALTVQSAIFCQPWSPLSFWPRLICWALFSIPAIWSLNGATCWAMLLRDLWGPGMRKKYPIKEYALSFTLLCIVISPFVLLWTVFGVGSVKAVEACQRRFCGDALEDGDENVELGDGRIDGERNEDIDDEGVDEDSVRLINNRIK
ncbi:uncharacterized protein LY89DRAFT_717999 [Mollisia scopiformis]|uniref:Uncharacterized protein n=1 Tax=Mollisia scopiformis TaxID=149040 RepID=A0A194XBX7_MOLSC|nr:uncharacterized protein LY89DRAFT_717999 [Mollisia scopiformis]KUJ17257.1 hypothetical protein LY89DRAFT_717999 [Mollisia scopiformis]